MRGQSTAGNAIGGIYIWMKMVMIVSMLHVRVNNVCP